MEHCIICQPVHMNTHTVCVWMLDASTSENMTESPDALRHVKHCQLSTQKCHKSNIFELSSSSWHYDVFGYLRILFVVLDFVKERLIGFILVH